MAKHFEVKQIRSAAGRLPRHVKTIEALGFRHVNDTVKLADTPAIRGMIASVSYLVVVTPVEGALEMKANPKRVQRRDAKKASAA